MRVTIVLLLLALAAHTHAKVYDRCKLAWELKCLYDIPPSQLADWVCLAHAESNYDTALLSGTSPGQGYGIFQIYDTYWCESSVFPDTNYCQMNCFALIDDSIDDDIACAKKIYDRLGFDAWNGWVSVCEGLGMDVVTYTSGCNLNC